MVAGLHTAPPSGRFCAVGPIAQLDQSGAFLKRRSQVRVLLGSRESLMTMEPWMHDVPRAVVAAQRQLRHEVPDLEGRFRRTSEALRDEVAAVRAEQAAGGTVPELAYADVAAGRVSEAQRARIKRRGCVVIRGVFDPDQIDEWNAEIVRYIDDNHYFERAAARAGIDGYVSGLAARPLQLLGLYWSRPQMLARQAES